MPKPEPKPSPKAGPRPKSQPEPTPPARPPFPDPTGAGSFPTTIQLFCIVLLGSFAYNAYVQWKKGPKNGDLSQEKIQTQASQSKIEALERELKEAKDLVALMQKDQVEIEKMFSITKIIERARTSPPVIRFSTNETRASYIAGLAKASLGRTFYSCSRNLPVEAYDTYKNCFRDLAIELHNLLERKIPDVHFFVAAGRVDYAFMVTTMASRRAEYFITIGEVLFELLEYQDLVTDAAAAQEAEETGPETEAPLEPIQETTDTETKPDAQEIKSNAKKIEF